MKALLVLVGLTFPLLAWASDPTLSDSTSVLKGQVRDAVSSLAYAEVFIVGTKRGAITDEAGHYRIDHVVPGRITIKAMAMGYERGDTTLDLAPRSRLRVDFRLGRAFARSSAYLSYWLSVADSSYVWERELRLGEFTADTLSKAMILDPETETVDSQFRTIMILNDKGNIVRHLGRRKWGGCSVGWDGKDDSGVRLPGGRYKLRLIEDPRFQHNRYLRRPTLVMIPAVC
jgi:hypothetical protein